MFDTIDFPVKSVQKERPLYVRLLARVAKGGWQGKLIARLRRQK